MLEAGVASIFHILFLNEILFHFFQLKLWNNEIGQWSLQGRVSRCEPAVHHERRGNAIVIGIAATKEREGKFSFMFT